MISEKDFIKYMTAIKHASDKEIAFDNAVRSLNKSREGIAIIYSDEIQTMIEMLCQLVDIKYNDTDTIGDDIQYFIYDCDWGNREGPFEFDKDGLAIYIHTFAELYDYLTNNDK